MDRFIYEIIKFVKIRQKAKLNIISQTIILFYWACFLVENNGKAFLGIELVFILLAFVGLASGRRRIDSYPKDIRIISLALSIITLITMPEFWKMHILNIFIILMGGYLAFLNGLSMIYCRVESFYLSERIVDKRNEEKKIFFLSFGLVAFIDLIYLFLIDYPGNLTSDSMSQITQILSNNYSNHHPYWHTAFVRVWFSLGYKLFHNINAAVAVFHLVQIIIIALIVAITIITLYKLRIRNHILFVILLCYSVMPYHVCYSATLWKDVLFSEAVLLFIVSLARIFFGIGTSVVNCVLLGLCGCAICIFRNNGWYAYILFLIAFLFIFKQRYKNVLFAMTVALAISFVMKYPMLSYWMDVKPTETTESYSIPLQQISRVVVNGKSLTEEQIIKISKYIPINEISDNYQNYISDRIKVIANNGYLAYHVKDFLKLWLEIGLEHPGTYFVAWIDQTKGYWCASGYSYWIWAQEVHDNDIGLQRTVNSSGLSVIWNKYLSFFGTGGYGTGIRFFDVFIGIGFNVWLFYC